MNLVLYPAVLAIVAALCAGCGGLEPDEAPAASASIAAADGARPVLRFTQTTAFAVPAAHAEAAHSAAADAMATPDEPPEFISTNPAVADSTHAL